MSRTVRRKLQNGLDNILGLGGWPMRDLALRNICTREPLDILSNMTFARILSMACAQLTNFILAKLNSTARLAS
jgi:hypothetical protein